MTTYSYIFDDYGLYNVYTYGAFFSLVMCIFLACKTTSEKSSYTNRMSRRSSVQALIGTAFIFLAFVMTANPFPHLESDATKQ